VWVLFGSPGGISTDGSQAIHSGRAGFPEPGEDIDGAVVGDVNGDGFADLVIRGAGRREAGAVYVLLGSRSGITMTGSQAYDQDTPGVPDENEASDGFGIPMWFNDTNGDGLTDLVAGTHSEENGEFDPLQYGGFQYRTALTVLHGSSTGTTATGALFFNGENNTTQAQLFVRAFVGSPAR